MTVPRSNLVCVEDTPYYHCIGRCVRRAYLCGYDEKTKQSFEHRRLWISERLRVLGDAFAIDICSYAILSNHYHLVVKLSPDQVASWSPRETIERWLTVFKGTDAARRYLNNERLDNEEMRRLETHIAIWQGRLSDLSWFMRCLNEWIARRANREDGCKGHFWESRFKSQALLDEVALLASMSYVDLNPIRARLTDSLDASDYTSVQDRIRNETNQPHRFPEAQRPKLMSFHNAARCDELTMLPFKFNEYLELVDATGRLIVEGERGFIKGAIPKLVKSLSIAEPQWLASVTQLQEQFELAIGAPERLRELAVRWGKQWIRGIGAARQLYPSPSG